MTNDRSRWLVVLLVSTVLALQSCAGGPTPSQDLAQARRVYTELRAILTVGQSVAVARGYLTPDQGDQSLRMLQVVQDGLDAGAVGVPADAFLVVADALLDALLREGRYRPEEVAAFKDLARHLVLLVAELQAASRPASQPGG